MRVVKAKTRRPRHKRNSPAAMRWDEGRTLFSRSVDIRRDELSMPVELLRRIRVVANVDRDPFSFLQAKQRTGKLSVVVGDRDDSIRRQFDGCGGDCEGVVGRSLILQSRVIAPNRCWLTQKARKRKESRSTCSRTSGLQKTPARKMGLGHGTPVCHRHCLATSHTDYIEFRLRPRSRPEVNDALGHAADDNTWK